jgi:hypothetical protein
MQKGVSFPFRQNQCRTPGGKIMTRIIWLIVSLTALLWTWTVLGFYVWHKIPFANFLQVFRFDKSTLSFGIWILFLLGLKDVLVARRETAREDKEALQIETLVSASFGRKDPTDRQLSTLEEDIKPYNGWFATHLQKLLRVAYIQRTDVSQEAFITILDQKIHISDRKAYLIVALGVVGTVVGILISLSGFDAQVKGMEAGSFEQIQTLITRSLSGLYTAFFTTLLGLALGLFILNSLIDGVNVQRESLLMRIQEMTESSVIPALNSWKGLTEDGVKKIIADYCETAKVMTDALKTLIEANKLTESDVFDEIRNALTKLEKPIFLIQNDIKSIAGEMGQAHLLVEQVNEGNGKMTQIADTARKTEEKLNHIFK